MEIGVRDKKFGIFLFEKFSSTKRGTSGVFYKDFGEKIKAAIKDLSSADKNLRYFIKKSGFQIRGDYFYSTVKPAHFAILSGKPLIEIRCNPQVQVYMNRTNASSLPIFLPLFWHY
eukprot:Em0001g1987a